MRSPDLLGVQHLSQSGRLQAVYTHLIDDPASIRIQLWQMFSLQHYRSCQSEVVARDAILLWWVQDQYIRRLETTVFSFHCPVMQTLEQA